MTMGQVKQETIPGFEDYVCTGQCLTHCPFPDGPCPWDDPDVGEPFEYPEFFWWREMHGGNEKYKEPEDLNQYRCPRCLSTEVTIGYPYIECGHCSYNEPLIDFPI